MLWKIFHSVLYNHDEIFHYISFAVSPDLAPQNYSGINRNKIHDEFTSRADDRKHDEPSRSAEGRLQFGSLSTFPKQVTKTGKTYIRDRCENNFLKKTHQHIHTASSIPSKCALSVLSDGTI